MAASTIAGANEMIFMIDALGLCPQAQCAAHGDVPSSCNVTQSRTVPSSHDLFSAAFTTIIAESNFQYTQRADS
jgi:hypothetical protein